MIKKVTFLEFRRVIYLTRYTLGDKLFSLALENFIRFYINI